MGSTRSQITLQDLIAPAIGGDDDVMVMAQVVDEEVQLLWSVVARVLLLPRLNELEEPLLDLLGWQYHVEGWEQAGTIERKRELVEKAIELHIYKGTAWAIETALTALGWPAEVSEWFNYSGDPYRFRVQVEAENEQPGQDSWDQLSLAVTQWKNLRSWLDGLDIRISQTSNVPVMAAVCIGHEHVILEPEE